MNRDMNLVREILKGLGDARGPVDASAFTTDRIDYETVAFHFKIMDQGGLIESSIIYADGTVYRATANCLTWDGADFLAAVRSDTVWSKTKARIAAAAGDAALSAFKSVAVGIASGMI